MRFIFVDRKSYIVNGKKKNIPDEPLTINYQRAFTLIELLVVITIIGILATFIVASFTSAQRKGRDAKRKSDLDAVRKALEFAKSDSIGGAYYPGCNLVNPCPANSTLPLLATSYIKAVPTDPSSSAQYSYAAGCTTSYCATSYTLSACLENANEPIGGNVIAPVAPCTTKTYQVTDL